jgi:hypothetical protein
MVEGEDAEQTESAVRGALNSTPSETHHFVFVIAWYQKEASNASNNE